VAFANYSPHRISDEPIVGMPLGPRKLYDLVPRGYTGPMTEEIDEKNSIFYVTEEGYDHLQDIMHAVTKYPNKPGHFMRTYVNTLYNLFDKYNLLF
jgi:hypothetical protein